MPDELQRTPLYARHAESGGRLVPFAGWEMPVQYAGVIDEVASVRTASGVFDVSHMGQLQVVGEGAHPFLQGVLSNDLDRLSAGEAQYTLLTNEGGGIVDDLIAYRRESGYLLVVNAANRDIDMAHLIERVPATATLVDDSDAHGMLALQGPEALALLAPLCEGIDPLSAAPFTFAEARVAGVDCTVARTGYTGEPGVELICPGSEVVGLWDALIDAGATPCGLGARDVLRLEVCYPLHGNDITQETNAIEAGLGWVCSQDKEFTGQRCSLAPAPTARAAASSPCAWTRSARCRGPDARSSTPAARSSARSRAGRSHPASSAASAWATCPLRWHNPTPDSRSTCAGARTRRTRRASRCT